MIGHREGTGGQFVTFGLVVGGIVVHCSHSALYNTVLRSGVNKVKHKENTKVIKGCKLSASHYRANLPTVVVEGEVVAILILHASSPTSNRIVPVKYNTAQCTIDENKNNEEKKHLNYLMVELLSCVS